MIITDNLFIQPLTQDNLKILLEMRNNPEINHFLTSVAPINEIQEQSWFEKMCLDESKMYFEIKHVNQPNSFMGIVRTDEWDKINRSIRIGVDILPKYQGKGFGQEALKNMIEYLFSQLNLNRIWLLAAEYNKKAIHIYEKLGFKEEGKQRQAIYRDGKYNDYLMFGLLKEEYGK